MTKLTPEETILARLETGRHLEYFKRKVHKLRLLVAGDRSAIDPEAPAQVDPDAVQLQPRITLAALYDALVLDFDEGTSNKLLSTIKTLVMQTCFSFPDIDFKNLDPTEAMFNAAYLNARLGGPPRGCNAVHHWKLALIDYLTGGLGWTHNKLTDGIPIMENADTLDVTWDQTARLITELRWVSVAIRQPRWVWEDIFGKAFTNNVKATDVTGDEGQVPVEFYYDVHGAAGTFCALMRNGNQIGEIIERTENPYFYDCDDRRLPFLPLEPMYFMALPSVRLPISLVEMMLPNQIALWEAEKAFRNTGKYGEGFYDIEEGSYEDDEMQKLREGAVNGIVVRKPGKQPGQRIPPQEVSKTLQLWHVYNEKEITSHGGVNPYASGSNVEGVQFAAEVNAIEGRSGLTAATIGKDMAGHVERCVTKYLYMAKAWDDTALTLHYDDMQLKFHAADPVKRYINADCGPVVREDTMQHEPREKQVQRAVGDLEVAQNPVVMQQFPNFLPKALEEYLRATGKKNIQEWMQPPMNPLAGMMGGGGMPGAPTGAVPAGVDANASTAAPSGGM